MLAQQSLRQERAAKDAEAKKQFEKWLRMEARDQQVKPETTSKQAGPSKQLGRTAKSAGGETAPRSDAQVKYEMSREMSEKLVRATARIKREAEFDLEMAEMMVVNIHSLRREIITAVRENLEDLVELVHDNSFRTATGVAARLVQRLILAAAVVEKAGDDLPVLRDIEQDFDICRMLSKVTGLMALFPDSGRCRGAAIEGAHLFICMAKLEETNEEDDFSSSDDEEMVSQADVQRQPQGAGRRQERQIGVGYPDVHEMHGEAEAGRRQSRERAERRPRPRRTDRQPSYALPQRPPQLPQQQ